MCNINVSNIIVVSPIHSINVSNVTLVFLCAQHQCVNNGMSVFPNVQHLNVNNGIAVFPNVQHQWQLCCPMYIINMSNDILVCVPSCSVSMWTISLFCSPCKTYVWAISWLCCLMYCINVSNVIAVLLDVHHQYEQCHSYMCPFMYSINVDNVTPDSKVHGANMGPTWVLSAPDGPHVGPMNLAIRDSCVSPCTASIPVVFTMYCTNVSNVIAAIHTVHREQCHSYVPHSAVSMGVMP